MTSLNDLHEELKAAQNAVGEANKRIYDFECSPEQNIYVKLDDAEGYIYERLMRYAGEACEGSHCYGESEYTQEFKVGEDRYIAKLELEYNRHDKTYYYIDGEEFTVTKLSV